MSAFPREASPPSLPFNGLAFVGEAWGEEEAAQRAPFVGASGQELTRMLERAGIQRAACYLTNVFPFRPGPYSNDLGLLCTDKRGATLTYDRGALSQSYPYPPSYSFLRLCDSPSGGYLKPAHLGHLARLHSELEALQPRCVVALGNTALWALTGATGISKARGNVIAPAGRNPWYLLPTYHPAAVLRAWHYRPTVIFDFIKALRVAQGKWQRPSRSIYIAERPEDIDKLPKGEPIAVDIETSHRLVTCLGLAPTPSFSLIVPFVDRTRNDYSYWDKASEIIIWRKLYSLFSTKRLVLHNAAYDLDYLLNEAARAAGIRPPLEILSNVEDTMILHHSLYPEIEKSLRHLGSIYTDEVSWKDMRARAETTKRGDDE